RMDMERLARCLDVYILSDPGMRETSMEAIRRRLHLTFRDRTYRQRLEQADPQDKARVQRRDPQTIIDEEFNKPTFNSHHTETRRQIAFDALDPEGKHLSDGTDFTEEMIRSADMKLLHRAMKHLRPEQRELLKKVFCENKSQTEIARAEGITEDAVRKRLVRIYERLRAAISFRIKIL
ncbi:MAG: sigma-70 family RNA polymerase sigma factor, partial [Clostridia bacterium]|nr:sigma-70 family RNA polymerase sigma factor [Clostridia bacterium]